VNAIIDDSTPHILTELADAVRSSIDPDRQVHLILENDLNQARYLKREQQCQPKWYTAQWNDDIHHALHTLITDERDGYYSDYWERSLDQLGRCLVDGFAYQGEVSAYRNGKPRGESTEGLPLTAFVSFLQNHDQIGNRAFGDRIINIADCRAVRAATAILLLAPSPPLLFMGEEFGAETPFLFFCDFEKDLATAVTDGRRNEFSHFARFADPAKRERIPDPNAAATFEASRLNWSMITEPRHEEWLRFYRALLKLRRQHVVPRLSMTCAVNANYEGKGRRGLRVCWKFPDDSELILMANLGLDPLSGPPPPVSQVIYASEDVVASTLNAGTLPPWSVMWFLRT